MTPDERQFWVGKMGHRPDWWALDREPIFEPDWECVDAHIHLWSALKIHNPEDPNQKLKIAPYLIDEYLRDAGDGHKLTGFAYIECGSNYRDHGPAHLHPTGETYHAARRAAQLAKIKQAPQLSAIISYADLRHPLLEETLNAHADGANGLLRGIRHSGARFDDPEDRLFFGAAEAGLYAQPEFLRGVQILGEHNLSFDAFLFHFQLEELVALAKAAPNTQIIVNHLGAPIGYDDLEGTKDTLIFKAWARYIDQLSDLPNVLMKLGGIASIVTRYNAHLRQKPPSSDDFIKERGIYFHHAINRFGAERCMFESNFPVDSISISYRTLWNAFKRIASQYPSIEAQKLLASTARTAYRF